MINIIIIIIRIMTMVRLSIYISKTFFVVFVICYVCGIVKYDALIIELIDFYYLGFHYHRHHLWKCLPV